MIMIIQLIAAVCLHHKRRQNIPNNKTRYCGSEYQRGLLQVARINQHNYAFNVKVSSGLWEE